jgi:hypothetical protein
VLRQHDAVGAGPYLAVVPAARVVDPVPAVAERYQPPVGDALLERALPVGGDTERVGALRGEALVDVHRPRRRRVDRGDTHQVVLLVVVGAGAPMTKPPGETAPAVVWVDG